MVRGCGASRRGPGAGAKLRSKGVASGKRLFTAASVKVQVVFCRGGLGDDWDRQEGGCSWKEVVK